MPIDDFDLSPEMAVDPLDVSGVGFGGTPPLVPPKQSGGGGLSSVKEFAPLLALLPLAAKGGPNAIGALLRGIQRGRLSRQQQGRQTAQDERLAGQQQSLDEYRRSQMENQGRQRKQQFMGQFNTALGGVDDPDAVRALIDFYGGQAQDFGVDRPALEQFAMQTATPNRLMTRKVSKRWDKMSAEQKEMAQRTQASLLIDGQKIEYSQWSPLVGGMVDPKTGAYPQAAPAEMFDGNTPEKAHLVAFARRKGKTVDQLTDVEIQQATKTFRQADDRPPDPMLGEIRELTAANLRAQQQAVASGALAPAQFGQAQQLGNDYVQETKSFWIQRSAFQQVLSANPSPTSPAGHMALIFAYMKLLDPNSVVRETEYANAQNASAVPDRIRNLYNRIVDGALLTPRQIADFRNQARDIYLGAKTGASQIKAVYDQRAVAQGLPPDRVTYMLDDPVGPQERQAGSGQPAQPKQPPQIGRTYNHPQLGKVRVTSINPDGTGRVEKVVP